MAEGAVWSVLVVVVEPRLECQRALVAGLVGGGVGPFAQHGLEWQPQFDSEELVRGSSTRRLVAV